LGIEISPHSAPDVQAYVSGLVALERGRGKARTDVEDVSNDLRRRLASGKGAEAILPKPPFSATVSQIENSARGLRDPIFAVAAIILKNALGFNVLVTE
jgi:hypothetical protein